MNRRLFIALALLVALIGLTYGGYAWHYAATHVWTDDAYVEGAISPVAAKVAGHVTELFVGDNQPVKRGDLLLRIDPRDYQAKRDQARAAVAVARASLEAVRSEMPMTRGVSQAQGDEARAALEGALTAVQSSESSVVEARARVESKRAAEAALRAEVAGMESTVRKAHRELERMRSLMQKEYVAPRDFDQAELAFETAEAALESRRRRLGEAEREVEQAQAELATRTLAIAQARQRATELRAALARAESQRHQVPMKEAELGRAEARLKETQADLAYAELQLQHTEVRAPRDGLVSKRGVEVGQVAQVGQPLLAIVPLHEVWVLANFKETQLTRIKPGLRAEVRVDSFPDRVFPGTVESISAGTGSRFSLLPPENATGNWVKVVQRVPVKIVLEAPRADNPHTLRAGMSVVVTVKVK